MSSDSSTHFKGLKKRVRTSYSRSQLVELENEFRQNKYPHHGKYIELANYLHVSEHQIKIWFQNRRMKYKKFNKQNKSRSSVKNISSSTSDNDVSSTQDHEMFHGRSCSGHNPHRWMLSLRNSKHPSNSIIQEPVSTVELQTYTPNSSHPSYFAAGAANKHVYAPMLGVHQYINDKSLRHSQHALPIMQSDSYIPNGANINDCEYTSLFSPGCNFYNTISSEIMAHTPYSIANECSTTLPSLTPLINEDTDLRSRASTDLPQDAQAYFTNFVSTDTASQEPCNTGYNYPSYICL